MSLCGSSKKSTAKARRHQVFTDVVALDRRAAFLAVDLQSGIDGRVTGTALPTAPGLRTAEAPLTFSADAGACQFRVMRGGL